MDEIGGGGGGWIWRESDGGSGGTAVVFIWNTGDELLPFVLKESENKLELGAVVVWDIDQAKIEVHSTSRMWNEKTMYRYFRR